MNITTGEIVTWLVVGALAGSLAGMLVRRRKHGFGHLTNLIIGLVGAVLGGFLFGLFHVSLNLGLLTISIDDLVSAFAGSLVFIGLVALIRRRR